MTRPIRIYVCAWTLLFALVWAIQAAAAWSTWTCSGAVDGCTKKSRGGRGETYGCAHAHGRAEGNDDGPARRSAAENCEAQLEATHHAEFFRSGTEQLTCAEQ